MRALLLLALLLLAARARADGLEALLSSADADHWSRRLEAVERLARVQGDGVFRLRLALLRDERPRVREAVAWAARLEPRLANATLLALALKDPEPAVRRAAARALVHFPDRRAVHALIEALASEKDARTRFHIVEALRALAPAPHLFDAAAWRAWWLERKDDAQFAPADEPPVREEYEGIVLETKTVAPVRRPEGEKAERAPGHVLVLPPFGYTTAVFGPYLLPLREHSSITWASLPSVQALTGKSGYGSDVPLYPVDRLVRALEAFRDRHGIERFVVLAQGAAGWIAMRYAQLAPERCEGLVLIDVALDRTAYAASLRRGADSRVESERFAARTLLHENDAPFAPATLDRLQALGLERAYRDPADLEIAEIFRRARSPQGFATVPPIDFGRRTRIETPAVFVYSAGSVFSGHVDAERIQQAFPNALVAPILESTGLPWATAPVEFQRILAAWWDDVYGAAPAGR